MNKHFHSFHTFGFDEKKLLFDSNSMYIFEIDEIIADIVGNIDSQALMKRKYGEKKFIDSFNKLKKISKISHIHSRYNKSFKKEREQNISSLWLNISHICNMKCVYCFAEGGCYKKKEELMDEKTVENAVDFLLKLSKKGSNYRLVFFGGEPLINFQVMKSGVLYAEKIANERNVSITFHLITNGTLLNKKIARFIRDHGITVQISVDGPHLLNDRLRKFRNGRGSYRSIYNNLLMLRQEGINNIAARVTVTHYNCNVSDLLISLYKIGFTKVSMIPVMSNSGHDYSLTSGDVNIIKEHYEKLARETIESIRNKKKTDIECFSSYISQLQTGHKNKYFCGSGFRFLTVTPDGKLYLCHRLVSKDVLEIGTLQDGINIPINLESWGKLSVDEKEFCRKCWARYFCGGGCAASALEKHDDFNKPEEISCEVMKIIIENAIGVYFSIKTLPPENVIIPDPSEDIPCASNF